MKKSVFTKITVLVMVLVLVFTAFGGCAKKDDTAATDTKTTTEKTTASTSGSTQKEPVNLKWYGAGWEANKKAATLIERWNKNHPEVKIDYVELNNVVNDQFFQKYDTLVAAGEQADMVYLLVTDVLNRAMNGAMLPIDEYIKASKSDFVADYGQVAESLFKIDGKMYGIPMAKNTFKVFYNKDVFSQKGITIPDNWTWNDFKEIAKKLNDPKSGVYGSFLPMTWQELTFAMAEAGGWKMVISENGKAKPNFNDPLFKKNMEFLYDLTMKDKLNPDLATSKAEKLNRRVYFAEKKTPMIVDGFYSLIYLQSYQFDTQGGKPLDFQIGVADFPRFDENTSKDVTHAILVGGFGIPKTVKHPQEAFDFARFICNENVDLLGAPPAYKKGNLDDIVPFFTNYTDKQGNMHEKIYPDQMVKDAVTISKQEYFSFYGHDPLLYAKYQTLLTQLYYQQYELYFTGQISLDEFVNNMQTRGAEEMAKLP